MHFSLPVALPNRRRFSCLPLLIILALSSFSFEARAGHGIFEGMVKVGTSFYNLYNTTYTNFQGASLGSFTQGQSLVLAGGEVKTYKNGGDDITGADLFYVIYPRNARPGNPTFSSYILPHALDMNASDQSWNTFTGSVDLLNGLPAGDYALEIYERSSINYNGGGSGNDYLSNLGANYVATFSVTAPAPAPLPVELSVFEASRQGADALLNWATASEKNNQGFDVQVSTNGQDFRSLGFVAGAGSSTAAHHYAFLDAEKSKAGRRYYRLRQQDADGTATYSPVRTATFGEAAVLSAAPQPFGAAFTLTLQVAQAQAGALLSLTDATGRRVLTRPLDVAVGTNQVLLTDMAALPEGMYVLQVALAGQPVRLRVVKQ